MIDAKIQPTLDAVGSKRVVFVTQYYGRARGGLGSYEEAMLPLLRQRIPIEAVQIQPSNIPSWLSQIAKVAGRDLVAVATANPCRVPGISRHDIVHLCNQNLALALWLNPIRQSIVTVQDIITYVEMVNHAATLTSLDQATKLLLRLNTQSLAKADILICVSEYTARELTTYTRVRSDQIRIIPDAVDHDIYYPQPVSADFRQKYQLDEAYQYVTYVGSRHPRKNLKFLCEVMGAVCREMPSAKLIIGGNPGTPEQENSLRQWIDAAGLTGHVRILPYLTLEELSLLMNASSILVYPSLYEGFGLPPLEAMACGCPTITSNVSSVPEVVGDAAITLNPTDAAAWKDAILHLLQDETAWQMYREKGLARASLFHWTQIADKTIELYREFDQPRGGR